MRRRRVSSSHRAGGRPRGLRTCSAISTMTVFQIHVDRGDIMSILENIKFLKSRRPGPARPGRPNRRAPMSEHPDNLLLEQQISTADLRLAGEVGTEIEARERPANLPQVVRPVTPAEI